MLTLDECVEAIKLVESGKSSRKVVEEFGVGCTQIQEMLNIANSVDPGQTPHSGPGLYYLQRLIRPNT